MRIYYIICTLSKLRFWINLLYYSYQRM